MNEKVCDMDHGHESKIQIQAMCEFCGDIDKWETTTEYLVQ